MPDLIYIECILKQGNMTGVCMSVCHEHAPGVKVCLLKISDYLGVRSVWVCAKFVQRRAALCKQMRICCLAEA